MVKIKHNLRVLIALWEVEVGEALTLNRLSEETGINESTLARYANGKSTRVDLSVCAKLLNFFNEGVDYWQYKMDDLFKMERVPPLFWYVDLSRGLRLGVDSAFACGHCGCVLHASNVKLFLTEDNARNLEQLTAICNHCSTQTQTGIYHVFVRNEQGHDAS